MIAFVSDNLEVDPGYNPNYHGIFFDAMITV